MSRATVVYLSMIVAFVAGLWGVMAAGSRLTAPEDLRGRWVAADGQTMGTWPAVTVQQSGRFFQLAFDNGPADVAVTVTGGTDDGRLSLDRAPWHVTIDGPPGQPVRTFHVEGPTAGTFTGHRAGPTTGPVGKEGK